MRALTRFAQFYKAFHSTELTWNATNGAASLQLAEGLFVSILLVTPFWTTVGLLLHALVK